VLKEIAMHLQFNPSTRDEREQVAAANRELSALGHLSGQASVAGMRTGTAAIAAHTLVRQPLPEVQITVGTLAGLPCETYRTPDASVASRIIYLHGGGFTRGSLALGRANATWLAAKSGVPVTAVAYRQAPEHRYPAAPDDTFAAWEALRGEGLPANQMAVVRLEACGQVAPAGVAALMPMTDLALSGASWVFNAGKDVADLATGRRLVDLYIDAERRREPQASPVHHHYRDACPVFIGIGSHDAMLSDAERTAHRIVEAGVDVTFNLYEAMPHGFTRFDVPIANQALSDVARWCVARLNPSGAD